MAKRRTSTLSTQSTPFHIKLDRKVDVDKTKTLARSARNGYFGERARAETKKGKGGVPTGACCLQRERARKEELQEAHASGSACMLVAVRSAPSCRTARQGEHMAVACACSASGARSLLPECADCGGGRGGGLRVRVQRMKCHQATATFVLYVYTDCYLRG